MRHVGLFAAFLLLLGLTTATAASFDVQAEDITSFSTPVSVSVPDPPVEAGSYFLRGEPTVLPGLLDDNPTGSDAVQTKEVLPENTAVINQTKDQYRHSWQALAPAGGGILLSGQADLWIFQNGGTDRVTAGLFDCPTADTEINLCHQIQIAGDTISTVDGGGYVERRVNFGNVGYPVDGGHYLRVQIVNRIPNPSANQKWSVQWGYKSNRPSRLDVTLAAS